MKSKENTVVSPWKALRFIFKLAPGSFFIMAVMELLLGLASLWGVMLTRKIFSLVLAGYTPALLKNLLLYSISLLLCGGYSVFYMRYQVQFGTILKFEERIRKALHSKSCRISNESLEMPKVYAYLKQADGARQNLFRYGQIYLDLIFACLQGLMLTAYLAAFQMWFLLLLPMSVLPVAVELFYKGKIWQRDYEASSQCQREEAAYAAAMADDTACKESRISGGTALLEGKWIASRNTRDSLALRKANTMFAVHLLMAPIAVLGAAGGLLVSSALLYRGKIDFAAFAAGVAAYESLAAVLKGIAGSAEDEALFRKLIQPFFRYFGLPERGGTETLGKFPDEIRLEDVSFRYPGAAVDAISHLSLTIHRGEVLAVAGENGAGKSTLANLILGIFQPTSGKIFYGDCELSELREESVHTCQSAVMQSFQRYHTTAGENIALGDPKRTDAFEIDRRLGDIFPDGEVTADTPLGKEFGGRELSGGQWQQLSCARGFYKQGDFLLLDEPTSAIDPLKERELVEQFREALHGKTGLIITHRLGAVSLANRVAVLERGKIIQCAAPSELLKQDGLFRTLWESQTKAYQE